MIRIGTMLYGYCVGYFGESYDDKRVEALGADWVVARDNWGKVLFADIPPEYLERFTENKGEV